MTIQTLKDKIQMDIRYNWTPDLTALRYLGGPIPVFIWDDLTNFSTLKDVLDELGYFVHHASVTSTDAYTVSKYVPFYNISDSKSSYPCYCLEEESDLDFFDAPDYTIDEARVLKGKMYDMSLEAIRVLDMYYENESQFDRVGIEVKKIRNADKSYKCFTWMNTAEQFAQDELNNTFNWKFRDDLDLTPFAVNEFQAYTYGGKGN